MSSTRPAAPRVAPVPVQRRILAVLVTGQILGGLGLGATLSAGALVAADLSGSDAWSGAAATMSTLGAALLAVPLSRYAIARGRRRSLAGAAAIAGIGAALGILAVISASFPLLLLGLLTLGAGNTGNLQARFAATDRAPADRRGRHLSLVVWSTTVGAVIGPNLSEIMDGVGRGLGLPPLAGVFLLPLVGQTLAVLAYLVFLRPDPLAPELAERARIRGEGAPSADARRAASAAPPAGLAEHPGLARFAIIAVALSHATMVALMSMTPVHLQHGGAGLQIVGFTISLHVAGMYALSPVFGWLSDRVGPLPTVLAGQALLLVSALMAFGWSASQELTTLALAILGLGWSASTVAGSALLGSSAPGALRVRWQGRSDLFMNLAGALGGALAGPMLGLAGYSGLALALLVPIGIVTVLGVRALPAARLVAGR